MDLNRVTLIGNLVKDPVRKALPSGQAVSQFLLATNLRWQDQKTKAKKEKVDYHDVVAWGKLAEIIGQYVKKGSKIYIEGRIQNRTWKGNDGKNRKRTEVVADNMIMLGHRGKRETDLATTPSS